MSDEWDFYQARVDHKPASIMVHLGIRNSIPLKSHPMMGYLRAHMNHPRADGLSSQEEFDMLCQIGDSIEDEMEASNGLHLFVGRNTSSNNHDFYFHPSDVENLKIRLNSVIQKFPGYEFEHGGREDVDWSTYVDFLYPNPLQKQQMLDRRVC